MSRCVIGAREHEARVGYLCGGHLERLGAMLREVEKEAALLSAVPSMQQRTGNRGGSLASHRSPARLDVIVHNDRRRGTGKSEDDEDALAAGDTLPVLDVLGSWARLVREERALTSDGPATVVGERGFLTRQLEWCAEQPWIDEMYDDIRTLLGQLRGANGTGADKPYCTCPHLCGGKVWVHDEMQPVWRRYPDRCTRTWEQAPGSAVCDNCGATWATDADKARLKRMVDDAATELARPRTDDGTPMLTAEEIVAQKLASSVSNVRVMAHRLGVKAVHGHYDPDLFRRGVAEPLGDVV